MNSLKEKLLVGFCVGLSILLFSASIVQAGNMIADWQLNGTGVTAIDNSGYGNDGIVVGAVLGGGVCTFAGKQDYIEITPYHTHLNLSDDFEIEAKATLSNRSGRRLIFSKRGKDEESSFSLETRAGQPWFAATDSQGDILNLKSSKKLKENQTYVLKVTLKADMLSMYVDGQLVAKKAFADKVKVTKTPLRIGATTKSNAKSWAGTIDYVKVFSYLNDAPAAGLSADPITGISPLTVTFDGGASSDPDGWIALYEWDFDYDGVTFEADDLGTDLKTVQHTYQYAGNYTAALRVTDNGRPGLTSIATVQIEVINLPPVAEITAPATGVSPFSVTLDGSASEDPNGTITLYEWDFDYDGVTFGADESGSDLETIQHTYQYAGNYTAALRVTDNGRPGLTSLATAQIEVINLPPVASVSADPASGEYPLTVQFDGSASEDPNGTITLYEWDFDGNGSIDASGEVLATTEYIYNIPGTYTASLKVTDNGRLALTDTATLQVEVLDPPPAAPVDFIARSGDEQVILDWADNTEWDLAGYNVYRKTATTPYSRINDTLLSISEYTDTGLQNGTEYTYMVRAEDARGNLSADSNEASVTPLDTIAPAQVRDFTATDGDTQISLSWTNPDDADFAGVVIVRKTEGSPQGPDDGTIVFNGMGTSCTDTGLANKVTYYYAAFAYDEVPNYSSAGAFVEETPRHFIYPPAGASIQNEVDNVAQDGDVIVLAAGTYVESVILNKAVGFYAAPGENVTWQGEISIQPGLSGEIKIKGIDFVGSGNTVISSPAPEDTANLPVIVEDCLFDGGTYAIAALKNLTILDSEIKNFNIGINNVTHVDATNLTISYCETGLKDVGLNAYGLYIHHTEIAGENIGSKVVRSKIWQTKDGLMGGEDDFIGIDIQFNNVGGTIIEANGWIQLIGCSFVNQPESASIVAKKAIYLTECVFEDEDKVILDAPVVKKHNNPVNPINNTPDFSDVKYLVILRDPIEFKYDHVNMEKAASFLRMFMEERYYHKPTGERKNYLEFWDSLMDEEYWDASGNHVILDKKVAILYYNPNTGAVLNTGTPYKPETLMNKFVFNNDGVGSQITKSGIDEAVEFAYSPPFGNSYSSRFVLIAGSHEQRDTYPSRRKDWLPSEYNVLYAINIDHSFEDNCYDPSDPIHSYAGSVRIGRYPADNAIELRNMMDKTIRYATEGMRENFFTQLHFAADDHPILSNDPERPQGYVLRRIGRLVPDALKPDGNPDPDPSYIGGDGLRFEFRDGVNHHRNDVAPVPPDPQVDVDKVYIGGSWQYVYRKLINWGNQGAGPPESSSSAHNFVHNLNDNVLDEFSSLDDIHYYEFYPNGPSFYPPYPDTKKGRYGLILFAIEGETTDSKLRRYLRNEQGDLIAVSDLAQRVTNTKNFPIVFSFGKLTAQEKVDFTPQDNLGELLMRREYVHERYGGMASGAVAYIGNADVIHKDGNGGRNYFFNELGSSFMGSLTLASFGDSGHSTLGGYFEVSMTSNFERRPSQGLLLYGDPAMPIGETIEDFGLILDAKIDLPYTGDYSFLDETYQVYFPPASPVAQQVTLKAAVFGGTPPLEYRWEIEHNGALTIGTLEQASCVINIAEIGEHIAKLIVRDSLGQEAEHTLTLIVYTDTSDSDGDSIYDKWELQWDRIDSLDQLGGAGSDFDGDGLSDYDEFDYNTDPTDNDTDGDGMLDGWEVDNGLDPSDPADANTDKDGDTYTNGFENKFGTDIDDELSYPRVYVDSQKSGMGGNGLHWFGAYRYLWFAIREIKNNPDRIGIREIWVKKGTYLANDKHGFPLYTNISIYGGFALYNPASHHSEREDIEGNETIIAAQGYHAIKIAKNAENVTIDGFTIQGGHAFSDHDDSDRRRGGGIYAYTAKNVTIENCIIRDNSAKRFGGGIYIIGGSTGKISNCRFINNSAGTAGGGLHMGTGGGLIIENCVFDGNTGGYGGGLHNNGQFAPVNNCLFINNHAAADGGGITSRTKDGHDNASIQVTNCTIVDNTAARYAGGVLGRTVDTYQNCIIWGNSAPTYPQVFGGFVITYSDVEGGYGSLADKNIDADPLFCPGYYYLAQIAAGQPFNSPCLDKGDPNVSPWGTTRTDGETDEDRVDMGYHYPIYESIDSDNDGLPDLWEYYHTDPNDLSVFGVGDSDGDGCSDVHEYMYGTDPADYDSDNDGIRDGWEVQYGLDPLTYDSEYDFDNDECTNIYEYAYNTNPHMWDSDADLMPDGWEIRYGLNPLADDANGNLDNDGCTNLDEYFRGINPANPDSDDDGMPDGWEVQYELDPLSSLDATEDPDHDGHSNLDEYLNGTDPMVPDLMDSDTDSDGMPDDWEVDYGFDPSNPADSTVDSDNDSYSNYEEFINQTVPTDAASPGKMIYRVDADAADENGNGHTWDAAIKYLYQALDIAESGDEIWVAEGMYSPDDKHGLPVSSGIALYGGFEGGENQRDLRNPEAHPTLLDGYYFMPDGSLHIAYHVLKIVSASDITIDGFTIQNGRAYSGSDDSTRRRGGGIFCNTVVNLTIDNCLFSNNVAERYGGGIYVVGATTGSIANCEFSGNSAGIGGGGMHTGLSGGLTIENCIFDGNAAGYGGGLHNNGASVPVKNCLFVNNTATQEGGGIISRPDDGVANASVTVTNCTIINNTASSRGGGVRGKTEDNYRNCIIYGNNAASYPQVSPRIFVIFGHEYTYYPAINYSCVEGGYSQNNSADNIADNPDFAADGRHLSGTSPCIDAGSATGAPPEDIEGNPRDAYPDMGAYEYMGP